MARKPGRSWMQLPATNVAVALPLMTKLEADSAWLSVALWLPEV